MTEIGYGAEGGQQVFPQTKFQDPNWTAKGEQRASVPLVRLETLWFNTGTLCNISCTHCYIESTPRNDRLVYLTQDEVRSYLDEIAELDMPTREIGFTGGEPFMNPDIIDMAQMALERGFEVLILTNAMQPMQRPRLKHGLISLNSKFGERLILRVSLDHYTKHLHETERGAGSWAKTVAGMDWLSENGFQIAIAGRTCWHEDEPVARNGYGRLIAERGWPIDATDPSQLVLFPEMDEKVDVPEITTACWGILGVRPDAMMCATSRMVIKRKGATKTAIVPCTLIAYAQEFEMGSTLGAAAKADGGMFEEGEVKLCHPHCAKFCVLGGGSCSIGE